MFTSEGAVVKSHHGISVKCSRYQDTGPTDPSLIVFQNYKSNGLDLCCTFEYARAEFLPIKVFSDEVLRHNGIQKEVIGFLTHSTDY